MVDCTEFSFFLESLEGSGGLPLAETYKNLRDCSPAQFWHTRTHPEWLVEIIEALPASAFEEEARKFEKEFKLPRSADFALTLRRLRSRRKPWTRSVLAYIRLGVPFEKVEREIAKKLPRLQLLDVLVRHGACPDALKWVWNYPMPPKVLWEGCVVGPWLTWLISLSGSKLSPEKHHAYLGEVYALLAAQIPERTEALRWAQHRLLDEADTGSVLLALLDSNNLTQEQYGVLSVYLTGLVRKYYVFEDVWGNIEKMWRIDRAGS